MCQSNAKPNLREPSLLARYTCAGISCAVFSVWWKFTFIPENQTPGVDVPMHSFLAPLALTVGYLISLPILKFLVKNCLDGVDVKILLKESMVLYNVAQVGLNGWMVWRFIDAVMNKNHPFIGDIYSTSAGASYAIWVHYCDKYLEFFDTYFMILRGRTDQVRGKYWISVAQEICTCQLMNVFLNRYLSCMFTIILALRGRGGQPSRCSLVATHTLEHS